MLLASSLVIYWFYSISDVRFISHTICCIRAEWCSGIMYTSTAYTYFPCCKHPRMTSTGHQSDAFASDNKNISRFVINSSPPGRNFADYIPKCIFMNEKVCISIQILLTFDPMGPIYKNLALVHVMEPAPSHYLNECWPSSPTHICGTRLKSVNASCVITYNWFYNISDVKFIKHTIHCTRVDWRSKQIHYNDVIMIEMASQITSLTIVQAQIK